MQSELLRQIETAAAKNEPCPKDLLPAETMLYYMLQGLYSAYQAGRFTKEQGHEMKNHIYSTYKRMAEEYRQFTEICAKYQEEIRNNHGIRITEV